MVQSQTNHLPILQDYSTYDISSATFKISDRCNLCCKYCYRENSDKTHKVQDIDVRVVERALDGIFRYKVALNEKIGINTAPSLYFIWHGGEPTIAGKEKFQEILEIQDRYRNEGYVIKNGIQTNGTLIDDDFAELFKREKFEVGISIDGPKAIQDIHRVFRNGKSSFEDTVKGIKILNEKNITWSAISVINREYIGFEKEIFDFFKQHGPSTVDFTPSFFYDSVFTLSPVEYSNFMRNMFDIWIKGEDQYEIRFFRDAMYVMGYLRNPSKKSLVCDLSGICHRNVSIGSNGDFYSCECLNSKKSNLLGNIMEMNIPQIISGDAFRKMSECTNRFCAECTRCDVFPICKAGCYNRRLPEEPGEPRLDYYCKARQEILRHIRMVCDVMLESQGDT